MTTATRRASGLRIGEAARQVGVSPSALRLWERQGLVRPGRSTVGRYRLYSDADVEQLRSIRRLRLVERVNAPGIRRLLRRPPKTDAATMTGARLRAMRLGRGL